LKQANEDLQQKYRLAAIGLNLEMLLSKVWDIGLERSAGVTKKSNM
jgi:hypothetical protein